MSQACDLQQQKVRNVILCPAYALPDYRAAWTTREQSNAGTQPNEKRWIKHVDEIKKGRIWNLTMLMKREASANVGLTTLTTIVDFHEVFSVPTPFLRLWIQKTNQPRLRLRPPYREHLSQGFARFFMRVGLPVDIEEI